MAETGHVIFEILINGIIADTNIDLVKENNDNDILWYRDYMVMIQGRKQEGKRHLLISLQSTDEFMDRNGPLKGFEVLKLNNPDNSLASPNPLPPAPNSPSQTLQYILRVFGNRNTIASAAITMIALVNTVVYMLRQIWEHNSMEKEKQPSARAQRLCRHFSLAEILSATENFNSTFVIGKGGFGKVYKGLIDNGQETVAIKRLKFSSKQGAHEFWTEIDILSELRHLNLVSLIGYCNEHQEMILVYEYMTCGTLADHLYKLSKDNNNSSLSWTQRLNICIGAGRGLDYLHTGHGIIHRDVKASNILLDEKFVAKVSDFGLAKPEKRSKLQSHVSTIVKGTYGYLDPYYYRTGKLTRKSDTYAFGVVLLEVLCGRPALDPSVEEDKRNLTVWARENIRKGELEQIISSNLKGEISPDSLKVFVRVSESCLDDEPKKRPTMAQVVLQLEFALEQQDSPKSLVPNETGVADVLPSTDEPILLANTGKLTRASTDEQNVASPPEEQTNSKIENVVPPSNSLVPNEIGVADVLPSTDEPILLASTGKVIDEQNVASPPKEETNSKGENVEPPSEERDVRRTTMHKQPRFWPWKRAKPSAKKELEVSISGQNELLNERQDCLIEDYETDVKVTQFDWIAIEAATNRFSYSHMIGTGRGGSFYKAVLPTRRDEVAVKRTSRSEYGHNMSRTEISLLSKPQHPNISKLLRHFIYGEEMILVYEFVESTSLHAVLLDKCEYQLPWKLRFKIITGIARGVLYLHQDGDLTLRNLYSDLEPCNILLDIEMNPKIAFYFESNFGRTNTNTTVVIRVSDYAAPESAPYPYRGISVTSDMYRFGVIVLEIVSGKRHRRSSKDHPNLITWAWELWNKERALDLMDASMGGGEFSKEEALKCIKIGLLCTQEQPQHRPAMLLVLSALEGVDQDLQLDLKKAAIRRK